MPPEDDFTRERDPRKQTTARIIGLWSPPVAVRLDVASAGVKHGCAIVT
jgi:hypothetical protein